MTTRRLHVWAAILLLLAGCSVEQLLIGQWYGIVTPPAGACPRLVWRFVVDPSRAINGYLSSDAQEKVATLSGSLAPDDTFQITAVATATQRSALITGQFTPGISTIAIHGEAAGPGCDGKTFQLRLGRYFATQGGGGGGR
jgi:hypothetical protein